MQTMDKVQKRVYKHGEKSEDVYKTVNESHYRKNERTNDRKKHGNTSLEPSTKFMEKIRKTTLPKSHE